MSLCGLLVCVVCVIFLIFSVRTRMNDKPVWFVVCVFSYFLVMVVHPHGCLDVFLGGCGVCVRYLRAHGGCLGMLGR